MEASSSIDSDINKHSESDDPNGDGEGVWSPDIEQCFQEALLLFPPCGRRKHILQDEGGGKMYGRNELIARYIMQRTGKKRTRKQVSSHIQVLQRRKAKVGSANNPSSVGCPSASPSALRSRPQSTGQIDKHWSGCSDIWEDRPIVTAKIRLVEFSAFIERRFCPNPSMQPLLTNGHSSPMDHMSTTSASNASTPRTPDLGYPQYQQQQQFHSNSLVHQRFFYNNTASNNNMQLPHQQQTHHFNHSAPSSSSSSSNSSGPSRHCYIKIDYTSHSSRMPDKLERIDIKEIEDYFPGISGPTGLFQRGPSDAFFLVKFWADMNNDYEFNFDDQNSFFGFSSRFEMVENYKDITCSTKACSYGSQVVEKVEKIYSTFNSTNGRYSFDINRSPMCEFMIQFIKKLRQLPRASQMNSVLENFTVLQVVTNETTAEILLCLAYVFEIASPEQNSGPQHHVYQLTGNL